MKSTVNQVIFSLATISWGVVPVYFYASGLISKYLSPTFHVVALIGGLAMIVLGAFNLLHSRRKVGCGHDHDHSHHDQSPVTAILLMVLPVMVCSGFTNHEYSKEALRWKGLYKKRSLFSTTREPFTREHFEKTTPKSPEGNYRLNITELYWSAGDAEIMKAYQDQPAEMEGRLIDEDDELNPGGNRKRLYRVFMTCCAADAQVLGIALEFDGPLPDFPDKTWVRVTGRVRFEKVGKQDYAYLSGCQVEPATAPDPKEQYRRKY